MNSKLFFLAYIINIFSTEDVFDVSVTSLLQNNCQRNILGKINSNKMQLKKIIAVYKKENFQDLKASFYTNNPSFGCAKDQTHGELPEAFTKHLFALKTSSRPELKILKIFYIFNCFTVVGHYPFEGYMDVKQTFESIKAVDKITEDVVELRNDGFDLHRSKINRVLAKFKLNIVQEFHKHKFLADKNFFDKHKTLKLKYFSSPLDCFIHLNVFLDSLSYLRLVDDDQILTVVKTIYNTLSSSFKKIFSRNQRSHINISNSVNTKDSVGRDISKNTYSVSYFMNNLKDRFKNTVKCPKNMKSDEYEKYRLLETFFQECSDHLKLGLLSNKIMLPTNGLQVKKSYLITLSLYICTSLSELKTTFENIPKDKRLFVALLALTKFKDRVNNLQKSVWNGLCNPDEFYEYISRLLGREIKNLETIIIAEQIICDFYNILACLYNDYQEAVSQTKLSYVDTLLVDPFRWKVVKALKVKTKGSRQLKAYDTNGKEVRSIYGDDWAFYDNDSYIITLEKIREHNIHKIEFILEDGQVNGRLEITDLWTT